MITYISKTCIGGLLIQRSENEAPLQFAATASFLSKLYSDYLEVLLRSNGRCSNSDAFTVEMLREFSKSQASINKPKYQTYI